MSTFSGRLLAGDRGAVFLSDLEVTPPLILLSSGPVKPSPDDLSPLLRLRSSDQQDIAILRLSN